MSRGWVTGFRGQAVKSRGRAAIFRGAMANPRGNVTGALRCVRHVSAENRHTSAEMRHQPADRGHEPAARCRRPAEKRRGPAENIQLSAESRRVSAGPDPPILDGGPCPRRLRPPVRPRSPLPSRREPGTTFGSACLGCAATRPGVGDPQLRPGGPPAPTVIVWHAVRPLTRKAEGARGGPGRRAPRWTRTSWRGGPNTSTHHPATACCWSNWPLVLSVGRQRRTRPRALLELRFKPRRLVLQHPQPTACRYGEGLRGGGGSGVGPGDCQAGGVAGAHRPPVDSAVGPLSWTDTARTPASSFANVMYTRLPSSSTSKTHTRPARSVVGRFALEKSVLGASLGLSGTYRPACSVAGSTPGATICSAGNPGR